MELRERLRPYTRSLMAEAHEKGTPVMRPLFYGYPEDAECWDIADEYLYGPDILAAPVCYADQRRRNVYLPAGETWICAASGEEYQGGMWIEADAPLESMPVFVRKGSSELLGCFKAI